MGRLSSMARRLALAAGFGSAIGAASPAMAACDVTTPTTAPIGSYSSTGLQANTQAVRTDGSFTCTSSPLATLLNGDYLRATLAPNTVLTLTDPVSGGSVPVTLSADAAGSKPLTPGTTVAYQDGALLTLLDNSNMRPAVFVRPRSAADLPAGTYRGSFVVRWDWSFCTQLGALGLLGACAKFDRNTKDATIIVTLVVTPKPAAVSITTITTWSPTSDTRNPKAVPGAKVRIAATIANPDTVPLDADTVAVTLATPPTVRLALEGDGTFLNGSVESRQGAKPSGLTLSYASPASTVDDVDFSADGGATWTYVPVAGDAASQAAVTTVRFRPRGAMAAGSSFAVSLPYAVK